MAHVAHAREGSTWFTTRTGAQRRSHDGARGRMAGDDYAAGWRINLTAAWPAHHQCRIDSRRHAANIVPDECEISVDRRTIPGKRSLRYCVVRSLLRANGLRAEVIDDKGAAPCWPMKQIHDSVSPTADANDAPATRRWAFAFSTMLPCLRRWNSCGAVLVPVMCASAHRGRMDFNSFSGTGERNC